MFKWLTGKKSAKSSKSLGKVDKFDPATLKIPANVAKDPSFIRIIGDSVCLWVTNYNPNNADSVKTTEEKYGSIPGVHIKQSSRLLGEEGSAIRENSKGHLAVFAELNERQLESLERKQTEAAESSLAK